MLSLVYFLSINMKTLVRGVLVLLCLGALGLLVTMLWSKKSGDNLVNPSLDTSSWESMHDDVGGFSFSYPLEFSPDYMSVQEWPPTVTLSDSAFGCAAPDVLRKINGHNYCIKSQAEGAAGSIYTSYVYSTVQDGQVVSVALTVRAVQCENYDEQGKASCEAERASFSLDALIDGIVNTVVTDPS